jgi:hypothetical protein
METMGLGIATSPPSLVNIRNKDSQKKKERKTEGEEGEKKKYEINVVYLSLVFFSPKFLKLFKIFVAFFGNLLFLDTL